jgi:hypothetical protein
MFVSGAWAAGDVSLLAYLQTSLRSYDAQGLDPVSAIMRCVARLDNGQFIGLLQFLLSFLYASYVLVLTFVVFAMGTVFDHYKQLGVGVPLREMRVSSFILQNIQEGFFWLTGVMTSGLAAIILLSPFLPDGKQMEAVIANAGQDANKDKPASLQQPSASAAVQLTIQAPASAEQKSPVPDAVTVRLAPPAAASERATTGPQMIAEWRAYVPSRTAIQFTSDRLDCRPF